MKDPESFDAFYVGTVRRVTAQLYAITGDLVEAEDCVQEAYARAWQRWRTVGGYDDPEAWVRKVACRIGVDNWRRALRRSRAYRRQGPLADRALDEVSPDHVAIIAALRAIPLAQRQAIVLYHVADMPVERIAAESGVSPGTVKARLARGRQALAGLLANTPPANGATTQGAAGNG